jgi:GNAT superfamily N-acetyltransferase
VSALVGWARGLGAVDAYLQVDADNAPALAFYERAGFWPHHGYHYRRAPGTELSS